MHLTAAYQKQYIQFKDYKQMKIITYILLNSFVAPKPFSLWKYSEKNIHSIRV